MRKPMWPLIGIAGHRGAGKNELANAITQECGWRQIAFADSLREGLLKLNPMIVIEKGFTTSVTRLADFITLHGWEAAKKRSYEVRRLMQVYGTEAGRDIHGKHCWVTNLHRRLLNEFCSVPEGLGWIITDVRFPNELDFVRKYGLGCIYVNRPAIIDGSPELQHESETFLKDIRRGCVVTVDNDGDIAQLHSQALVAFRLLTQRT